MAAYPVAAARPAWRPVRPRRFVRAVVVAAAVALTGAGAFAAGEHHQSHGMTIMTGVATVGADEASIPTNGWIYGLAGSGSVTWVDSQGVTHDGGWPGCLTGPGTTARVRFGWVPVTLPDGMMIRQVVWVDCES